MLLWLPLALAVGLYRPNVRLHLLWLFIPLVTMKLGLMILAKATDMPSEIADIFEYLSFGPLLIGMATLLLLGNWLGQYRGWARIGLATLILLFCIGMGIASYGLTSESAPGLLCFAVMGLTVLLAQIACIFCCRKRFRMPKYCLWLALYTLLFTFLGLFIYLGVFMILEEDMREHLTEIFMQFILMTAIFSAVLYAVQLPFALLGRYNRFYQERFTALLGFTMSNQAPSPTDSDVSVERTPAIE